jgi:WD40 repeat protein
MSGEDRQAFLDAMCGQDDALRAQVEAMFVAETPTRTLISQSTDQADSTCESPSSASPGTVIAGKFKLVSLIGEGGMGAVWLAEQSAPVRRHVALKLIKPGMDSRQVLARFDAERQALAMMDHPNIARVFDGGMTEDGRPYFVMEFVQGIPLTDYCDQSRLALRDRLRLFATVCRAVQHAHQKGIIHRDLKPSNILACLHDGIPTPKIIDFGLAKAMHQPLTEQTLFTASGAMVGTPRYMSPEQAGRNNLDVDTRTDIYSLGVVLYELLTGTTPIERQRFRGAAYHEVHRLINEVEPPKPSSRLQNSTNLGSVAAQRNLEPGQLQRAISGELDWIVMKSLEKDRSRRYESASGLARDIERFLNQEPIDAGPPSTAYRLKKLIGKHRRQVFTIGACLLAFALTIGIVIQSSVSSRLRTAYSTAQRERNIAEGQRRIADNARVEADKQRELARRSAHFSRTSLAGFAWQKSQLSFMDTLLANDREDQLEASESNGFELNYLKRLRSADVLVLNRHRNYVTSVAYSPDGKFFATASEDSEVHVWDAATGALLHTYRGHSPIGLGAVAINSDGTVAASADWLGNIRLWELATGKDILALKGHNGPVMNLAFDRSGSLLASLALDSAERTARVWDVATGAARLVLPVNAHKGIAISPDGKRLVADTRGGKIGVYDAESGDELLELIGHSRNITALDFNADGSRLLSASLDGSIRLWDSASGAPVWRRALGEMVFDVDFTPDDQQVLAGGDRGMVYACSAKSGELLFDLRAHSGPVNTLAACPNGAFVLTGGEDNAVKILGLNESQSAIVLRGHEKMVTDVAFSYDGKWLASSSEDGTVRIWSAEDGQFNRKLEGHGLGVTTVAFSPVDYRLASGAWDCHVLLWNLDTNDPPVRHIQYAADVTSLAFSPDGTRFVSSSGGSERKARVCDGFTNAALLEFAKHTHWVHDVAFSPNGTDAASIDHDQGCYVWNTETGEVLLSVGDDRGVVGVVAFHPQGHVLATSAPDNTICIWKLADGKLQSVIPGHSKAITALQFTPDGSRLASSSRDGMVRLWDYQTGQLAIELAGHKGSVTSVAISPDGYRIASCGEDRTVRLWNGSPLTNGELSRPN